MVNVTESQVAENMITYGGGFVAALGLAWQKADPKNAERIQVAFPEYWARCTNENENLTQGRKGAKGDAALLRSALAGLVGASTREELVQMELGVRVLPGSDDDKAIVINALAVLLATLPLSSDESEVTAAADVEACWDEQARLDRLAMAARVARGVK